jgi:DNA uptake protein ComE-like DNA-binding protein
MVKRSRLFPVLLSVLLGLALQAAPAQAAKSKSGKVNLNTATQEELEALPGVGEATAKKIVAGRPYASVDDLSKAGVSASTISKIKSKVTVSGGSAASSSAASSSEKAASSSSKKTASSKSSASTSSSEKKAAAEPRETTATQAGRIDVNTASESELEALPGIGAASAKKIIAARPYKSLDDLSRSGVSSASLEKARPHLMVSKAQKVEPAVAGASGVGAGSASSSSASKKTHSEPASTSSAASPSTSGSSASTRSSAKAQSAEEEGEPEATARTAPARGMVWVNTSSKVYHYEGDRWYGKTKEGKFMTESDAIKAGYRASKEGAPKTQ